MIDTQQYNKINICGEISIIVVQAHSGRKKYMHIYIHLFTYIWGRRGGGGDEREYIHISSDSSPICKRHLESLINYFFPNRLVETSGDWMDWQHWVHKTQDEDKQYRHTHYPTHGPLPHVVPNFPPHSQSPPPPPPPVSDILTTGYISVHAHSP